MIECRKGNIVNILAEEKGFRRINDWPEVVDNPLSLVIETTECQFRERRETFYAFMEACHEGIVYLKNNRDKTIRILCNAFDQSPMVAVKTFDDYLISLNDPLTWSMKELKKTPDGSCPR